VQNMPGAGGIRAMNFLAQQAPKDGTAITTFASGPILEPLIGARDPGYDMSQFTWVGALTRDVGLCLSWGPSPFKTIDDARRQEMIVAGTGAGSDTDTWPIILNEVLGTKFKVITGYDTAGASLAVERGEVDGLCGVSYATLMASNPHWLLDRNVNVLAQLAREKDAHVPDAPMVLDMVKDANDHRLLDLILVVQEVGRPVMAPPGVPKDRLAVLHKAFADTMADPAFVADAERLKLEIDPLDHGAIEALLKTAYASPRDVVERASKLLSVAE